MLWTEYRPVIKIGPKGAMGNHEIRPVHSAPNLGQSIPKVENGPIGWQFFRYWYKVVLWFLIEAFIFLFY